MEDVIKITQIIYNLFPFFFTIIVFGLILKKGVKFLQKYKWFWLIGMIVTGFICIQVFLSPSVKGSMVIMAVIAFGNCYTAYMLLTKKDKRKVK